VKDPATGRRRSRRNDPRQLIVEEVPELRIIDDELWNAVKARQTSIRESEGVTKARATRFWEQRRAQHLLTGLVHCGACGSRLASVGRDYLACSAARGQGTCTNRKGVRRSPLEELILEGLRQRLMAPDMVEEFVAAFHEEVNRHRRDETAARAGKERELAEVTWNASSCRSVPIRIWIWRVAGPSMMKPRIATSVEIRRPEPSARSVLSPGVAALAPEQWS
jgi:hypothetical protein